jgi:hypothetical protein
MHLRPGREALGGQVETGLDCRIRLDHNREAPAVLGPDPGYHPVGKFALEHQDGNRKTNIKKPERNLGRCRIREIGNRQIKRGNPAPGRITVLYRKLSKGNLIRKGISKLLTQDAVEFDGMDDCAPFKQGTGECPVARPNLEHLLTPNILKIRNPLYRMRINEEVLVVVRFHRVVKT